MLFKNKPTHFPRMLVLQDQFLYYARFQTWESGIEKCGHPILIPNDLSTVTPGLLMGCVSATYLWQEAESTESKVVEWPS